MCLLDMPLPLAFLVACDTVQPGYLCPRCVGRTVCSASTVCGPPCECGKSSAGSLGSSGSARWQAGRAYRCLALSRFPWASDVGRTARVSPSPSPLERNALGARGHG